MQSDCVDLLFSNLSFLSMFLHSLDHLLLELGTFDELPLLMEFPLLCISWFSPILSRLLELATIQILSLLCQAPCELAEILKHWTSKFSASNPSIISFMIVPFEMLIRVCTFSPIIHLGLTSLMTLSISGNKNLSSSFPFCFPAIDIDWQGNPPTTTSALYFSPLTFLTSPSIGMFLKFFCKTF